METEWDRQKERGNKHSYLGLWKELLMRERERENSLKQTPSPPSWGGEKVGWDDPAKSSAPSKWKTKAHGESKIQTTQRTNAISFAVNTQNWKRMLHWCFHVLCSFIGSKQQWKCQKIYQNVWQDNIAWLLWLVMLVLNFLFSKVVDFKCSHYR